MSKWTRDYMTGVAICAICGQEKGKRTRCCRTAPWVSFETFCARYFPGYTFVYPGDGQSQDHYISRVTARDFYDDYLCSNAASLAAYIKSTTSAF